MARQSQFRRVLGLALLLAAGFVALGFRLVDLQVLRHAELRRIATQNTEREYLFEPLRGSIMDAQGNLLAATTVVKLVCADPTFIGDRQAQVARVLAPLLEMDEATLMTNLVPRLIRNANGRMVTNQFVKLKPRVPLETWDKIQAAMETLTLGVEGRKLNGKEKIQLRGLREKAVFARDQHIREYPNQRLAAHVLGYTQLVERELNGFDVTEMNGIEGIENSFNSQLRGVRGWRVTEWIPDRKTGTRELVVARDEDVLPQNGLNVVLTIDSVMQHIVESALADAFEKLGPTSITAVVIRPRTGEILALANVPTYDPNTPGDATNPERRNRVVMDVAEPGSTFKIVTVSGALSDKNVGLNTLINCENGLFSYGGKPLHDHHPYDLLSVQDVIAHSSNIGAAKIALLMGSDRLYQLVCDFGFGTPTGIPLPSEVGGKVHPVKKWDRLTIVQMPMGHAMTCTGLQMAMAMAAVANDGCLMRPMLVRRLEDQDGRVLADYSPQRVRQVIKPEAAKQMTQALKAAVSQQGTAAKAMLEHYTVAGKTGTAQKNDGRRYLDTYYSSFVGFFPADNPEICIAVSIDEPPRRVYYGGQSAAPIFKQIAEAAANYLNIPPEDLTATETANLAQSAAARATRPTSARALGTNGIKERQP